MLTLALCINTCRAYEATTSQIAVTVHKYRTSKPKPAQNHINYITKIEIVLYLFLSLLQYLNQKHDTKLFLILFSASHIAHVTRDSARYIDDTLYIYILR